MWSTTTSFVRAFSAATTGSTRSPSSGVTLVIACGQFDYKRVFAYSTISSLGYMVMGLGVGSAFGGVKGRTQLPGMVKQYMEGEIKIDEMITHTMGLEEINHAFDLMHEGKSIRSVIHY